MATNKHAMIRYQALDKCFGNPGRKYFLEDLMDACSKAIEDFTGSAVSVSKRQIFEDIKFMESAQGWSIELDKVKDGRRVFYRYLDRKYSINNRLLNEQEENQVKEALLTLSRFKGMPQFEWVEEMLLRLESSFHLKGSTDKIIEFEQNPYLRGLEYLSILFDAILYRQSLVIDYKGFKQVKKTSFHFHPYYLKAYNNRWFVFGCQEQSDHLTNLALDRILNVRSGKMKYKPNDVVNFDDYFEDTVGVTMATDAKPAQVLIEVARSYWPYIETKPIHGSQKVKRVKKDSVLIELYVHLNYEFKTLLFSFGENIKILQPEALAQELLEKAIKLIKHYR
ncbi:WYL domain-containing protein [Lacibacter sp.]|uniref:helix-turn-helix transcriptional regulator n=1 Tax=Lacibacter sp. TaxID=1915409 RepID=UPI002B4AF545|nr:WYL domain-containing protein [Lacibacter sp.]HLP38207.1 WYL domain-containing protein [Lacibacter sp.]